MRSIRISTGDRQLDGDLEVPPDATGIVIFAHGSGSGRKSSRNRYVASVLNDAGIATLLMDLLTLEEEAVDVHTAHLRFDIPMLAGRVGAATDYIHKTDDTAHLHLGYFGASTGAGAALIAAAESPHEIRAVVSRGGRPDLAAEFLPRVKAPTLLIVGENDEPVIEMNKDAMRQMSSEVRLEIVPGATHLFEEPGTLEQAADLAKKWFLQYLH